MKMFIKLRIKEEEEPIRVNVNNILLYYKDIKTGSCIEFSNLNEIIHVIESIEEIDKLINVLNEKNN